MCKNKWKVKALSCLVAIGILAASPLCSNAASEALSSPDFLYVCGSPIGMRLESEGLMVTGYNSFLSENNEYVNPSKDAGLAVGDVIFQINGEKVGNNEELEKALLKGRNDGSDACSFVVMRGNKEISLYVKPERERETGEFKIGVWVKDSSSGIGTITFYDDKTGFFGALGHGISDSSTHELFPTEDGDVYEVVISGVKRGYCGAPGELRGYFREEIGSLGEITDNTDNGVYGYLSCEARNLIGGRKMSVDSDRSVHEGAALILATVNGNGPAEYKVWINGVDENDGGNKGISLTVKDEVLLGATGGIVQGLSGSPIIQDGKLVGAVTHVLVNDPTRGYGIFIENMLDAAG